jgi:hypothetical protein
MCCDYKKFLVLSAIGVTDYFTPIEYEHIYCILSFGVDVMIAIGPCF